WFVSALSTGIAFLSSRFILMLLSALNSDDELDSVRCLNCRLAAFSSPSFLLTNEEKLMPWACSSAYVPHAISEPSFSTRIRSADGKNCSWCVTRTRALSLRYSIMHLVGKEICEIQFFV